LNTIVFGDTHGFATAVKRGILLAEELACKAIFLGDYVDRGPTSLETLRLLIKAKKNHPDWIFIRGNHDQMLLNLIHNKAKLDDQEIALNRYSFCYSDCGNTLEELKKISDLERLEIVQFLEETISHTEDESFIYCHGILRDTNEPLENKTLEEWIWNYDYKPTWKGKTFIHGHLPCNRVTFKSKGININTKCGYGGVLTGLYFNNKIGIDEHTIFSISEDGEELKRKKSNR
jgi:serine/threonine protein phosphatase 1